VAEQNVGLRMMDSSARVKKIHFFSANGILEEVIVIIILTGQRLRFIRLQ